MKQTFINKYLAGETNISEERELKQLLLETPDTQRSKAERSILELLSYSESEEVEEDIFAVDYTEEYDKHVRPLRTIRLWPCLAAACIAALLVVFHAPPREEAKQVAKVEKTIVPQKEMKDSVQSEIIPQPAKEEMHIAQVAKKKTYSVRSKQEDLLSEPEQTYNDLAMVEESHHKSNDILPSPTEQRMEEFYDQAAYIQRHGQQLMHRISMQNNNTYNINQTKDL